MSRAARILWMAALVACGSKQTPRDPCLTAVKAGPPPAEPSCAEGTEPRSALAPPSRLRRIPGPGASAAAPAAAEPAERRWCEGADGVSRGPYVGLDRSGAVVESGSYNARGERDGTWIIWGGVSPRAVGVYRDGVSVSLQSCDFGGSGS